jgi:2-desacetyl-2-hydroxyethyl bacteriochlorophyllide A dehydrogenase
VTRRTVPALHLSSAPHRLATTITVGRFREAQRHGGVGAALRLREVPAPVRRPGWVRVAPTLAGICASDRKALTLAMGRQLLAFYGVPPEGVVLGHEVVGTVVEADADAPVAVGDRVVPEPFLSCSHKGLATCARCAHGDTHWCAHQADAGDDVPGLGFGFHARFGGGWSTELVVPADRALRVPDDVDDRAAVLAEPTAVAIHAVLRDGPRSGERALVIGPGTIGLSVVHALRRLASEVAVTVVGIDPASDANARTSGAHHVVHGRRQVMLEALADHLGSSVRRAPLAGVVLEDGFDVVYDAVGSSQTIDDGLRALRPGGRLVLLGLAGAQRMDWSLAFHRELTVRGSAYYAEEELPSGAGLAPGRRRAIAVALELLADLAPGHLVTHVFELDEVADALRTAAAGPRAGAVKVTFAPRA